MSISKRAVILVLVTVLFLLNPNAFAQKTTTRFEEVSGNVKPGDVVTVVTTDESQISGEVLELDATSIVIDAGKSHQRRTLAGADVARIQTTDPVGNGVKIGAGIGAAAGLVGGLLVNTYCYNETGSCPGVVILLTGIGAAAGAAAGWGLDSVHGSRLVFDRSGTESGRKFGTDFFASVVVGRGVGHKDPFYPRNDQQISIAVGIGRRAPSGFGFEGEVQSTVQSAVKLNPCLPTFSSLTSGCLSGPQGTEALYIATGRVVYALHPARFQPYVGGGVSVLYRDERYAYASCCGASPTSPVVIQGRRTYREFAVPVSGGVQVPLSRSFALRPAFTYYVSMDRYYGSVDRAEVSVGIVYRRK